MGLQLRNKSQATVDVAEVVEEAESPNPDRIANVIIDGGGSERAVPIVPTLIFGEREEVRERTGTAKHIAIIGLDRAIGIAVVSRVCSCKVDIVVVDRVAGERAGDAGFPLIDDVVRYRHTSEAALNVYRGPVGA